MISEEKIQELVNEELEEAKKKHGEYFNSWHEKASVLLEEVEEARFEIGVLEEDYKNFWCAVKCDYEETGNFCKNIKARAIKGIQELIQVCAMCDKQIKE